MKGAIKEKYGMGPNKANNKSILLAYLLIQIWYHYRVYFSEIRMVSQILWDFKSSLLYHLLPAFRLFFLYTRVSP